MAKSKVDFKQVLLQHGERIGIGIAGVLAVLMVAMSLFMPGSGLFSGSPSEKAKVLEQVTQQVDNKLRDPNNLPGEADKPDKDADKRRVDLETTPVDAKGSEVKALVSNQSGGQMGRRLPKVFPIEEGVAKFTHMQIQSYIFDEPEPPAVPKIYALRVAERASLGNNPMQRLQRQFGLGGGGARGRMGGGPGGGMLGGGPGGGRMGGGPGGGRMGGGPGMGMGGGMGGGGLGELGGLSGTTGAADKQDKELIPIRLNELEKAGSVKLAEQVRPLRMAIIAASFPYKKQVEEFRSKLGMRYVQDVLGEVSQEVNPEGQAMSAFRFAGVRVERRELDGDGNPIAPGTDPNRGFEEIDLYKTYRPYIILTGKRFEPEDDELRQFGLLVDGLAMPRLMQFRDENVGGSGGGAAGPGGMAGGMIGTGPPAAGGGRPGEGGPETLPQHLNRELDKYPNVEKDLSLIKKTLQDLKGKNITEVARPPDIFNGETFDIFRSRPESPLPGGGLGGGLGTGEGSGMGMRGGMGGAGGPPRPGMGGMTGGPPRPGMGGMTGGPPRPGMGEGPGMGGPNDPGQELELPEYCLVRLVDVTVQPGKTYEYRLRVRMANPNMQRRDVASPDYAKDKEILSEWSQTPIRVHIDQELTYYAVNQEVWERTEDPRTRYVGPHRNTGINPDRQVWLQAHRWLESVKLKGGNAKLEFGEWTIAERMPVYRGEYAGRIERVEAPVWRTTRESFVIASDASTSSRAQGIGVYFGHAADETKQPEALVVDFDNGGHGIHRVVSRVDDEVKTTKVSDQCGQEVLLMRPDGRLMLLEGARDFNNPERVKRIDVVRKRIQSVKVKEQMGTRPFGGIGGPGGPGGGSGGTGSPDG